MILLYSTGNCYPVTSMEPDNVRESNVYVCVCDWVTLLHSRNLTEHCKPAVMEKNKNHFLKKGRSLKCRQKKVSSLLK